MRRGANGRREARIKQPTMRDGRTMTTRVVDGAKSDCVNRGGLAHGTNATISPNYITTAPSATAPPGGGVFPSTLVEVIQHW
ncbi:MAG: hypothetical protein U0528_07835 [Anaerolineae bacterium]